MNRNKLSQIGETVDSWIAEEDLPVRPFLKPIRKFDGLYPDDEEEREAYFDFMRWAMSREHLVLLCIPKPNNETDFWQVELDEFGNNVSAFNTMDFRRLHPFRKYNFKLKKIYEKVRDLAQTHSCISHEEGRDNIYLRFKNLVENEFRDEAVVLLDSYKKYPQWVNREKLFDRVRQLNREIRKCKQIWRSYANQL